MRRFRSVLFWTHLTAGAVCGVVILVMSFTGVVLAFKPQIQNWVDRDVRYVEWEGAARMAPSALIAAVKSAKPEAGIQSLAFERDPETAVTVGLGGRDGNVFVNPYTGDVLGSPSGATAALFQSMTTWHRYMGFSGESRPTGRAMTGASNLAFLLLGVTGLYIWWPKKLSVQYLRPVVWFKRTSTGRARDFNWHNTIGFWCLPAIIIMAASGVMMSYTWGNNLVYRLAGSPVPAQRGGGPGGPGRPPQAGPTGGRLEGRSADTRGRANEGRPASETGNRRGGGPGDQERGLGEGSPVIPASLDQLVARAEQQVPTWSQLSMRLPNREGAPVSFTLTDGAQWNAFARSQLTLNTATMGVEQWQSYDEQSRGQKLRGWLRFAHTGELGGGIGQLIAGLGCLGGVFLVYTGISLAIRRLWNWKLWKPVAGRERVETLMPAGGAVTQALTDEG